MSKILTAEPSNPMALGDGSCAAQERSGYLRALGQAALWCAPQGNERFPRRTLARPPTSKAF